MKDFEEIVIFIRSLFPGQEKIPLHTPVFYGNEKQYVLDAIDSTFVSSVGEYVNRFERDMAAIAGTQYAVAIVNGTSALHIALIGAGVERGNEVLSQSLTFIATANAISYIGADAVFIDIDTDTLGMSPYALEKFLQDNGTRHQDGSTINRHTGKKIAACVPMHTFGMPCRIDEIVVICKEWGIALIEDAAESIGSSYKGKATGSFGLMGTFSFNGNKTITCGGGGAVVTNDASLAARMKHLTTQAKEPHKWEFRHDAIGYNYRMPNLNAALACAQLEQLPTFIENKRELADAYHAFFSSKKISYVSELKEARANYWLNAILFDDKKERDDFLAFANDRGVLCRPVWELMNTLPMFRNCKHDGLKNSQFIADRIVNIPSSVRR